MCYWPAKSLPAFNLEGLGAEGVDHRLGHYKETADFHGCRRVNTDHP